MFMKPPDNVNFNCENFQQTPQQLGRSRLNIHFFYLTLFHFHFFIFHLLAALLNVFINKPLKKFSSLTTNFTDTLLHSVSTKATLFYQQQHQSVNFFLNIKKNLLQSCKKKFFLKNCKIEAGEK